MIRLVKFSIGCILGFAFYYFASQDPDLGKDSVPVIVGVLIPIVSYFMGWGNITIKGRQYFV